MIAAVIIGVVVLGILLLIVSAVIGPDRYAEMTEEEFEQEAKRSSLLGAAMVGLEKAIQPKQIEFRIEHKQKLEESEAGGEPPEEEPPD